MKFDSFEDIVIWQKAGAFTEKIYNNLKMSKIILLKTKFKEHLCQ